MSLGHAWSFLWAHSVSNLPGVLDWMVVLMLVAPALLLGLAVWAAWNLSTRETLPSGSSVVPATVGPGRQIPVPRDGAEKIARERLARGEISVDDYERIISVLRG